MWRYGKVQFCPLIRWWPTALTLGMSLCCKLARRAGGVNTINALKQARSFTSTGECDGMRTMSTGCAWGLQTDSVRMGNHHRGVTIQLLTVQTELVMVWVFLLFEDSNFGQFLSGKRPWSMVASPVWWIAWTILLRCRVAAGHERVSCTPVMKGCDSWAAFALWHRFIVLLTIVNPKNFLGLMALDWLVYWKFLQRTDAKRVNRSRIF